MNELLILSFAFGLCIVLWIGIREVKHDLDDDLTKLDTINDEIFIEKSLKNKTFKCEKCSREYEINVMRFTCACGQVFKKKQAYVTKEDMVSNFLTCYTEMLASLAVKEEGVAPHLAFVFEQLLTDLDVFDPEKSVCVNQFKNFQLRDKNKACLIQLKEYARDEGFSRFILYSGLSILLANDCYDETAIDVMDELVRELGISDELCEELIIEAINHFNVEHRVNNYDLLNVSVGCSERELKAAYRSSMKQHHPDKYIGLNLPRDILTKLEQKTTQIQQAYEFIRKEEGYHV